MQLATVSERAIGRPAALEALVEEFISDQDVAESSRATYRRQLRQFIAWLRETGRADAMAGLQREDILAFKDYTPLLRQGLLYSLWLPHGSPEALRVAGGQEDLSQRCQRSEGEPRRPRASRKDCLTPGQLPGGPGVHGQDQPGRAPRLRSLQPPGPDRPPDSGGSQGHSGRSPAGVWRGHPLDPGQGPGQQGRLRPPGG